MIKLMHCADIHLDSPFASNRLDDAEQRRRELRAAFAAMTVYARDNGVDLVLIAGDLFDAEYVTQDNAAFVRHCFAGAPECRFIIAPGNHDPYTANSVYAQTDWPGNVYIFDRPEMQCFHFDDIETDVYGYAFTSSVLKKYPLDGTAVNAPDRIQLLCAHGDLGKNESEYCPISMDSLMQNGFDYAALGHIHAGTEVSEAGGTRYAYSGCLMGRDFGEAGLKSAIIAAVEKTEGTVNAVFRRKAFTRRHYETMILDVTGAQTMTEILDLTSSRIRERGYEGDTMLRIRITGMLPSSMRLIPATIADAVGAGLLECTVYDETLPIFDQKTMEADRSVRGEFLRRLTPLLSSEDEEERERAALALRYGIAALSQGRTLEL